MSPEEITRRRAEWFAKTEERRILIEKICAHSNSHGCYKDKKCEEYQSLIDQFRDSDPPFCEHGRSRASDCRACDDIHKEIFPEYFGTCTQCSNLVDKDELDSQNKCFDCHAEEV